jgi:hypothetical protein
MMSIEARKRQIAYENDHIPVIVLLEIIIKEAMCVEWAQENVISKAKGRIISLCPFPALPLAAR